MKLADWLAANGWEVTPELLALAKEALAKKKGDVRFRWTRHHRETTRLLAKGAEHTKILDILTK